MIFSCTKAITASAVWLLIQDGLLEPGTCVGELVDGFRAGDKRRITVEHLLTHTAEELAELARRRPDDLHLVLAENAGELVGGSLLFRATPRVALGFYTARADVPAAERCMNLVTERCLVEAHARGYRWLDFGTSSVGGELNRGLAEFKEGFGGVPYVRETWRVAVG